MFKRAIGAGVALWRSLWFVVPVMVASGCGAPSVSPLTAAMSHTSSPASAPVCDAAHDGNIYEDEWGDIWECQCCWHWVLVQEAYEPYQYWVNPNANKVAEVYHSATNDYALVDIWGFNDTNTQWWFNGNGQNVSGWGAMKNKNSGKCLTYYPGAFPSPAAGVYQVDCRPDDTTQKWWFDFTGQYNGGYPVYNVWNLYGTQNGLSPCLGVPWAETGGGVQLDLWNCNDIASQWR